LPLTDQDLRQGGDADHRRHQTADAEGGLREYYQCSANTSGSATPMPSAFSTMVKRALGTTLGRYFSP
jgi:hypothetical protein